MSSLSDRRISLLQLILEWLFAERSNAGRDVMNQTAWGLALDPWLFWLFVEKNKTRNTKKNTKRKKICSKKMNMKRKR